MSSYDLKSLKLPVLSGASLKLFASAFGNPLIRPLLKNNFLKTGGILKLRQTHFDDVPLFSPLIKANNPATAPLPLSELTHLVDSPAQTLPYLRVRDYVQAYKNGTVSPVEIAESFLAAHEASERLDPPLRAFVAIDRQDLLKQAEASARRIAEGKPLSLLDGVPVTIKDEMDMMPFPTRVGTLFMGSKPAQQDATVVARLRAAGALLLGKANMHEIGINPDGTNLHYGRVCNPWNLSHDTGGSSSGPCASVAAGFSPIALGADGGGSIRIPAAHCGLVGMKPTYGRISEFGAAPLGWSIGNLGPIACSVEDLTLAYAIIAGPDKNGPLSQFQPPVSIDGWDKTDLQGMRLGIFWDHFTHAQEDIVAVNKALVAQFVDAGAQVVEIEIPELDNMRIAHVVSILGEMATCMNRFPEHADMVAPSTSLSLNLAHEFTTDDYLQAQQIRSKAMKLLKNIYQKVDVIITPATAATAPYVPEGARAKGWSNLGLATELMRFVFLANLLGLPAISFPAGYSPQGLPIGMQAMGDHWSENVLLRIAYVAEQYVERRTPAVHYRLI